MGYDFVIKYKKGTYHVVANGLSRREGEVKSKIDKAIGILDCNCTTIFELVHLWLDLIKEKLNENVDVQQLIKRI